MSVREFDETRSCRTKFRRGMDPQSIDEYIEEIVAQAPPLSATARDKLSALLGARTGRAA
ncbi:hypothetical protein [Nocardia sp. CA-135398]|uniref:hypothetical protein n=1 Tax=Nocardia sp. CA-135398 TaxID=3239977 RepID=UPI003D958CCA